MSVSSPRLWRCLTALHFPQEGERSSKLWVDKNDDEWDSYRYALSAVIGSGDIEISVERARTSYSAGA